MPRSRGCVRGRGGRVCGRGRRPLVPPSEEVECVAEGNGSGEEEVVANQP